MSTDNENNDANNQANTQLRPSELPPIYSSIYQNEREYQNVDPSNINPSVDNRLVNTLSNAINNQNNFINRVHPFIIAQPNMNAINKKNDYFAWSIVNFVFSVILSCSCVCLW